MASMDLVAALFAHLAIGASAILFAPQINSSADWLVAEDYVPGQCTEMGMEEVCDVATNAKGSLRADKAVRPLFVKFHKVGGTTLMQLINTFADVTQNCGRSCGDCFCEGEPSACTGHIGKSVLVKYVQAVEEQDQYGFLESARVSSDTQLIPMEERRHLFAHLKNVPLHWQPLTGNGEDDAAVVLITLLRDPVERVRSKFYFERAPTTTCLEPCLARQMPFLDWMRYLALESHVCCEYVSVLGQGSVLRSKKVLASLFDVVGITEHMDKAFVDVASHFGVPAANLPSAVSCRDNADNKEPWTKLEKWVATKLTVDDREIYKFALELNRKRRETP